MAPLLQESFSRSYAQVKPNDKPSWDSTADEKPTYEKNHWAKPSTEKVTWTQPPSNEKLAAAKILNDRLTETATNAHNYEPGRTHIETHDDTYAFEDLRPRFPNVHWEPLTETPHYDKGLQGDPQFRDLLSAATDVFDYNPKIGTEIHGVNLAKLTNAQKNDLARLISTRGVVFFRGQDDLDIDAQRELGAYFGKLHKHATTSVPARPGLEDVHVVYTDEKSTEQRAKFTPTFLWHSDVTYEVQPPSYTALKVLSGPPRGGGGDTLWSSQYAVYDVLSTPMQKYLESLTALHSADIQAEGSKGLGRPVRRDPVTTEHPLIRTHPVTGWKSVFFNPGFVTQIVGIPKSESDMIITYLNEIIATTQELHVRFQWNKGDVAFWDNRICVSKAGLKTMSTC